mmetsp:Transcript_1862/g.4170  ORF Transcript_1862/g.4170 Transcript_1862/m.4170 type:complete len:235 (-) Transcript_1862:1761-2465(-)
MPLPPSLMLSTMPSEGNVTTSRADLSPVALSVAIEYSTASPLKTRCRASRRSAVPKCKLAELSPCTCRTAPPPACKPSLAFISRSTTTPLCRSSDTVSSTTVPFGSTLASTAFRTRVVGSERMKNETSSPTRGFRPFSFSFASICEPRRPPPSAAAASCSCSPSSPAAAPSPSGAAGAAAPSAGGGVSGAESAGFALSFSAFSPASRSKACARLSASTSWKKKKRRRSRFAQRM